MNTTLYNRSLRFLVLRPRSEKEIKDYLSRKSRPEDEKDQEEVFNQLVEEGLIDDEAFARWWIKQRTEFRPKGAYFIKRELLQKGVDSELVDRLISELVNQETQIESALELARKRGGDREKLDAYLSRRGFSWNIIREVFSKLDL